VVIKVNSNGTPRTSPVDPELLSGLVDGELDAEAADRLVAAICIDPEARRRWIELHLVGDALHSSEVAACHADSFCERVSSALAGEATVLAPRSSRPGEARRYWLPGAAVAASVAVIGFIAVPLVRESAGPPAVNVAATQSDIGKSIATDDSRRAAATVANARALDPYLVAHRELTGGATLPRAAPYLRSVVDRPAEGR
jgi:negative regulator of sigma E activity